MSNEQTWFSGRLVKRTLPMYGTRPDAAAPVLKRVNLGQGELAQILDGSEGVRYLAAIELRAGGVRGNHVHFAKRESIYLIQGALDLVVEDLVEGGREEIRLLAGDLVRIAPRVAHALRTVEPGWAVEFAPDPLDPSDSHRHELVAL